MSLDGIEFDPVKLISGLCQGGPASGILFEISVDPLLMTLEQLEGVVRRPVRTKAADGRVEETDEAIVSGFVDDWSLEFEGPKALNTGLTKIATFEIASGQRMNREKTVIVPARKLTNAEEKACRAERKKNKNIVQGTSSGNFHRIERDDMGPVQQTN